MHFASVPSSDPYYETEAVTYWDASGSVRIGEFQLIVGCNNILDKEPPYFPGTGYNGNPQVYDFIGRYFWTRLGYTFR